MATTIPIRAAADVVEGDQCVTMRGLDWKGYLTMLRLRGERSVPRMVYLDGDLLLASELLHRYGRTPACFERAPQHLEP